ncbi:protein trichome birefringence-like 19 [Cornus florida]|uniref:protein trichome birefringence-like 19 n=1 Tax=Cornus florida TaxID=4283 RepID=UPI00289845BB|nr:protein trichome birefringence-like 19 [Cornus florida]
MKVEDIEIPVNKHQTRRKTTVKIAPVIALAIVLITIIPVYYPMLKIPQNYHISQSFYSFVSFQKILEAPPPPILDHSPPESSPGPSPPILLTDKDVRKPPIRGGDHVQLYPKKDAGADAERPSSIISPTSNSGDPKKDAERPSTMVVEQYPRKEVEKQSSIVSPPPISLDHLFSPSNSGLVIRHKDPNSWNGSSRQGSSGDDNNNKKKKKKCDVFSGNWVRNPEAPYYSNKTCWEIQEHQNCMKFGRPDTEYMKWKWKPNDCELPIFDPVQFLELVRGKSLAFVGDSVARNHMQSLICLLSKVEYPVDVSISPEKQSKRYEYRNYNFTIAIFWSPYLVRTTKTDPNDTTQTRPFNLFLDESDPEWTTQIEPFHYVIISAGHWFFRPSMFYVERRLVGCLYCQETNVIPQTVSFSYRRAFRTSFRTINRLKKYKGMTFLRTFAPSHFEQGVWNEGGDCQRTRPFRRNETKLEEYNLEVYKIQVKELGNAQRLGRKRKLKFRLLDVTKAMLLRADGHPSKYGHWPNANVSLYNDCVHWCLPGPIDTWNDFLLNMMKMENR